MLFRDAAFEMRDVLVDFKSYFVSTPSVIVENEITNFMACTGSAQYLQSEPFF